MTLSDVPGGESRSATWVVRGDVEGEYNLSATYTGIVAPIEEPLVLRAETSEPLKVWGGSALRLIVEADETITRYSPYDVWVSLENVSDVPVYNAAIEIFERPDDAPEWQAEYQILTKERLQTTAVIMPGESFRAEYTLLAGIGNDENPDLELITEDSFVQRTGGNVDLEWEIRSKTASPKLEFTRTELDPVTNDLHLEWEPVDGAVEYHVYEALEFGQGFDGTPAATVTQPGMSFTPRDVGGQLRRAGMFYLVESVDADGHVSFRHRLGQRPPRIAILGDSYISGEGTGSYMQGTDTPLNKCHRSWDAWPMQVTEQLGLLTEGNDVLFVACSGAIVPDVLDAPQGKCIRSGCLSQMAALNNWIDETGLPDVVFLSVGGNDAGFTRLAQDCLWLSCDSQEMWLERADRGSHLYDTIQALQHATDGAAVFHAAYPHVIDAGEICTSVPLSQGNAQFLETEFLPTLNNAVFRATERWKATYVSMWEPTTDHSMCAGDVGSGQSYFNGLTSGGEIRGIFGAETFHPTTEGHTAMASWVWQQYGWKIRTPAFVPDPGPPGPRAPSAPDIRVTVLPPQGDTIDPGLIDLQPATVSLQAGSATTIYAQGLEPGATALVVSESIPTVLGSAAASDSGELRLDVTLPSSWHPGVHLVYLVDSVTNRPVAITQYLVSASEACDGLVGPDVDGDGGVDACDGDPTDGPLADFDGDGVANGVDTCVMLSDPQQIDSDANGFGDACEPGTSDWVDGFRNLDPIPESGGFAGAVTSAGGAVRGAQVRIYRSGAATPMRYVVSHPDGKWAVAGLQPGSYEIQVLPPSRRHLRTWVGGNGQRSAATNFEVIAGNTRSGINTALGQRG